MEQHIIRQQVFDIRFSDPDKAYMLQNRISDIFQHQLTEAMEQLFSRLVPDDKWLSMGDVAIDVGMVAYNMLEYTLTDRILEELEKEIVYRLSLVPSAAASEEERVLKDKKAGYARLLEYFLLTGALPWWASGERAKDPLLVMETLLEQDAERLRLLILRTGRHDYVRRRLVQQFTEQAIRSVITLLEPAQAIFVFDYHATVVQKQRDAQIVEQVPISDFEKALWEFILTYLLVDRGSLFNQKMFIRSVLMQLVRRYSRRYEQVLLLLAQALESTGVKEPAQNTLSLIIRELSSEALEEATIPAGETAVAEKEATRVLEGLELFRHYLVFGSLPWWTASHTREQLAELMQELLTQIPATLSEMLREVGRQEVIRGRMVWLLEEPLIIRLVQLIEPAQATFIIHYIEETQAVHTKQSVVYADSRDFKKAVWKFVLDFLLEERGSVFNRRVFLESNIRRLARHYNVQVMDMLRYLVQSIGEDRQASTEHAPLFRLLMGLLHEWKETMPEQEAGKPPVKQQEAARQQVLLKDVLLHWIAYGYMPWWGETYLSEEPAALFRSLLSSAPEAALLLLYQAGNESIRRQRILSSWPQPLLLEAFSQYAGGQEAIRFFKIIIEVYAKRPSVQSVDKAAQSLLELLWETYRQERYYSFSPAVFLRKVIQWWVQRESIDEKIILEQITDLALAASMDIPDIGQWLPVKEAVTEKNKQQESFADLWQILAKKGAASWQSSPEIVLDEVIRVLEYFITHHRLPAPFTNTNPFYIRAILRQLLQFLFTMDPQRHQQLLSEHTALQAYMQETATAVEIDGDIGIFIARYLSSQALRSKEEIVDEALHLLEQFLTTGMLPESLANGGRQQVLQQLLLLLQQMRPAVLKDLLQRSGYNAAHKMQLHDAIAYPASTTAPELSRLLRTYLEHDLLAYLHALDAAGQYKDQTVAVIIRQHLAGGGASSLLERLLKHAAVARYLARYYTEEQVYEWLGKSGSADRREMMEWTKGLQAFLLRHTGDTLQRMKLNTLLKEFNLLVAGGSIYATTFAAYLKELLSFIAAEGHTWLLFFSNMFGKDQQENRTDTFTRKMPELLQALEIQQRIVQAEQDMDQLLRKADEKALHAATGLHIDRQGDARKVTEEMQQRQQAVEVLQKQENPDILMHSGEPIYIENAGLVLLHPFLSFYFIKLGLLEGGQFIGREMQHRAVNLLQYLVNGPARYAEHALVLNKVLCNVPVEESVPESIELAETEKELSESLLRAVIQQWEKIKNSSVEGFRASFLHRRGVLLFKEDAWHLKVERAAYDVLLESLPWSISMIKTSWMDKILYVEWT